MTDNNADETGGQNSNLSRRTALALMGTSAVGGAAATSAFSKLTADRPVDLSVNTNELDAFFNSSNELVLANNTGSSIDLTVVPNDNLTSIDNLENTTLNGASIDHTADNQITVTGIDPSSSVSIPFGRFTGPSTVDFEVQWDNGADGFDISSTESGSPDQIQRTFIFGGRDSTDTGGSNNYEFGPTGSYIDTQNSLSTTLQNGRAVTIDGTIYILASGGDSTVYKYDPAADSFEAVTDGSGNTVTLPVSQSGVAVVNGIVYCLTGQVSGISNAIHQFDPSGPSTSRVTDGNSNNVNLPGKRRLGGAVAINGMVYFFGGYDGSGSTATIYQFDPSGPSTSRVTDGSSNNVDLPYATREFGATVINGTAYIISGKGSSVDGKICQFDPSGPTASKVTDGSGNDVTMPIAVSKSRATSINGIAYLFGGVDSNSNTLDDIYQFDPSGPSTSAVTDGNGNTVLLPNGRYKFQAASI